MEKDSVDLEAFAGTNICELANEGRQLKFSIKA